MANAHLPTRRPGIWVANGTPTDAAHMLSWQPGALTSFYDYLGPNRVVRYKRDHPDVPIIIRFQHPQNWELDKNTSARHLADLIVSKWPVLKEMDPYVYFANEINLHYENGDENPANQRHYETRDFYATYADWVRLTTDRIQDQVPEMRLVCPPFAFGHHEDGAPDDNGEPKDGWAGYDYLADTIRECFDNIITFHAYWGDASGYIRARLYDPEISTWYAFRWRRLLNLFAKRYSIDARVIIDEAGNMDAGHPSFTDQAIYYAQHCLADSRVIALTYFLWEDPTYHPGNVINSWVQCRPNLSEHTRRLATMPHATLPAPSQCPGKLPTPSQCPGKLPDPDGDPTIRVLMPNDTVTELPLEEYLRGVVPAEMPALWPMQALKAQAIAARTYATYAIAHPHYDNVDDPARGADICTTTHTQTYNPAKIHPNTDRAIRQTAGMLILYDSEVPCDVQRGEPIQAFYSANCGGLTKDNATVWGGEPRPYLIPVDCPNFGQKNGHGVGLCQWGARDMAIEGDTYVQILHHYYSKVTLSPPPEGN